jgi:general secretion pathway protein C
MLMTLPSEKLAAMLPYMAIAALLLLLAAQLAMLTWKIIDRQQLDLGDIDQTAAASSAADSVSIDWNSLPLFGKVEVVKKSDVKKIPQRRPQQPGALQKLDVTLIGVLVSSNPDNSYISIKEKNDTRVLRRGEEIQDGVVVKSIEPRTFVASDGAAERTFYLIPEDQLRASEREKAIPQESSEPEPMPLDEDQNETADAITYQVDADTRYKLEQYRGDLEQNPLSLADKVRASPVQRNGELYGYRLLHGEDRELLASVGLRAGDILLGVNDSSITDPAQLNEVIESLATGNEISLKIERGGKARDLNVVLE